MTNTGAAQHGEPAALPALGVRTLLLLAVPALAIGVLSAFMLWLLNLLSSWLETFLWDALPKAFGIGGQSNPWWIVTVLTITGIAVGLVVWLVPGHGGPDSATTGLDSPPPPMRTLPSIAIVVMLGLAGGVSLGPENPIIAINCALAVFAVGRFTTKVPAGLIAMLALAGTIGALFGTPVAAALLLTGAVGAIKGGGSLWDKLFVPLAAGAAGSITMHLLGGQTISFTEPTFGTPHPIDFVTGIVVAGVAAGIGILAAFVFPFVHTAFHAMKNPLLFCAIGGILLGVLGAVGGPLTLFKGLDQTGELLANPQAYSAGTLALLVGVKLVALLVAASSGFRGGRVFPIVFIGVAFGLFAHAIIPDMPIGLAVACGSLGFVLAETRDGWIALFIGIALTGDLTLLPILCVILLPTWLLVTKAPPFEITPKVAGLAPRRDSSS